MRALCVISGGMDSATCAYIARREGYEIVALHFDYNQRTMGKERECFGKICDDLGVVKRLILDARFIAQIGGSALTDGTLSIRKGAAELGGAANSIGMKFNAANSNASDGVKSAGAKFDAVELCVQAADDLCKTACDLERVAACDGSGAEILVPSNSVNNSFGADYGVCSVEGSFDVDRNGVCAASAFLGANLTQSDADEPLRKDKISSQRGGECTQGGEILMQGGEISLGGDELSPQGSTNLAQDSETSLKILAQDDKISSQSNVASSDEILSKRTGRELSSQNGEAISQSEAEPQQDDKISLKHAGGKILPQSQNNKISSQSQSDKIPPPSGERVFSDLPSTYVPFRNGVFLSIAAALAEKERCDAIFIGVVQEDSSGYPDCGAEFIGAFERALDLGTSRDFHPRIKTPLVHLSKVQIVSLALEIGVPLELTWSCYEREDAACGLCDSCLLRLKGFAGAGAKDKIPYAIKI